MVKSLTSSELDKTLAHYESRGAGQLSNRTTENSLARFSAQIRGSFCNNPNASSRDQQARTLQRIDDALTKRSSFDHHNTQIDYEALKTQHAELITQGKNSVDIAQWIGHKLNISSWRA